MPSLPPSRLRSCPKRDRRSKLKLARALIAALLLALVGAEGAAAQTTVPVHVVDVRQTSVPVSMATLNASAGFALNYGEAVLGFTVTGLTASAGTLTPQISNDGGTTWTSTPAFEVGSGNSFASLTTDGQYRLNAGGATNFRLLVTLVGTGSAGVSFNASSASSVVTLGGNINVTASNPSVGTTGSPTPGSATLVGLNKAGTLTGLALGSATSANSVPVVVASDQTLTVTCTNCGGGSVTSNQGAANSVGNAWPIEVTDGTRTATVKAASTAPAAADPALVVAISPNTPTLPVSISGTPSVSVSGSVTVAQATGSNLHVVCDSGCGSSLSAPADESTFTAGTTGALPVAGFFQTTATNNALLNGQSGAIQLTAQRAVFANPRNSSGTEIATASNPLRVDPTGTTTQPVSIAGTVTVAGTGSFTVAQATGSNLHVVCDSGCSSSTAPADEAAFTAGTTPQSPVGGFFQTTATNNALTTGQMGAFQVTAQRALFVNPRNSSGTEIATASNPYRVDPTGTTTQPVSIAATVTVSGTVNQGTANTAANGWPTKVTDGTNVAAVKAASTAPAATDPALVVAISPNTGTLTVQGSGSFTVAQATGTNLHVVCDSGCSSSTAPADEAAFTAGTTPQSPVGGFFQTTATNNPLTTGQMGAFQVTANRALFVNLRNAAGTELGNSSAPLSISVQQIAGNLINTGTGPSSIGTQRVAVSQDSGVPDASTFQSSAFINPGGVYNDTILPLTSGQTGEFRATGNRAQHLNLRDSLGREVGSYLPSTYSPPLAVAVAATLQKPAPPPLGGVAQALFAAGQAAAVKPANVSPSSYDPAQVVVLSPNPTLQCPFDVAINQTATSTLVTNPGSKRLHICSYKVISASAQSVSLIEGTGTNCGTGTTPLDGGATGTNAYAANGGEANISSTVIIPMQVPGDNLCLVQTGSGNVSGRLTYGIYSP